MLQALYATWRPHAGPQTAFLESDVYEVLYGGQAGGGKSLGMLADAAVQTRSLRYAAVLFRKTYRMLEEPGGLIRRSQELYPSLGATYRTNNHEWSFPSGAQVVLRHLQHSQDRYDYQGAEFAYIGFDQLEQFEESDYLYLFSRTRTPDTSIEKRVRATANPGASWVLRRWLPWLGTDEELRDAGLPHAKPGEPLWFIRENDKDTLVDASHPDALSRTFIPASVYDNPTLMQNDPDYIKRLKAMPWVERRRLLDGDWHVQAVAGTMFFRDHMPIIALRPALTHLIRSWDLAGTEKKSQKEDPDYTATVVQGWCPTDHRFWIVDAAQDRLSPFGVDKWIDTLHQTDPPEVVWLFEQDPGQAGKKQLYELRRRLSGRRVIGVLPRHDKIVRAGPLASAMEADQVVMLKAAWNEMLMNHLLNFPSPSWHDDLVDACASGFSVLSSRLIRLESRIL